MAGMNEMERTIHRVDETGGCKKNKDKMDKTLAKWPTVS